MLVLRRIVSILEDAGADDSTFLERPQDIIAGMDGMYFPALIMARRHKAKQGLMLAPTDTSWTTDTQPEMST